MPITQATRKILWGRSGNRCARCRRQLVESATALDDDAVVGEECHIFAQGVEGPRSAGEPPPDLHHHSNLILLCSTCHTIVDRQPGEYTIAKLRDMRAQHEGWVNEALDRGSASRTEHNDVEEGGQEGGWGDGEYLPGGVDSDVLWEQRLADAFPGTHGVTVISSTSEAIERLVVALRRPLHQLLFDADGQSREGSPFWWFRGGPCMHIDYFAQVSETHCYLDGKELNVARIAAYRTRVSGKRDFLYVETSPDTPTGLYEVPADLSLGASAIAGRVHHSEEYAVWNDRPISRRDYDDGSTLVDGRPRRVLAAELRQRFLTPYNFLICGNRHAINEPRSDALIRDQLDRILSGDASLHDLADLVESLPLPSRYY